MPAPHLMRGIRPVRMKKPRAGAFVPMQWQRRLWKRLLPILLDSGGAQSSKAVLIDRELPGKEFIDGQRIATAGFLKGEQAAANCGNDFGLTANDPPLGTRRG